MKIVVLATNSPSTWMVVNSIRDKYPDVQVALEKPISRFYLLYRRVQKQGVITVIGQLLFMLYLPLLRLWSRSQSANLIYNAGVSIKKPYCMNVKSFDSVNSNLCQAWLEELLPDIVIVNGTRILSRQTLKACPAVFLNTHCGITPAYRGVHGGYWAFASGDSEHAGVTIHLVDAGIDTGDIVYQKLIEVASNDNFLTYPVRQYLAALPLLDAAIRDVQNGALQVYQRNDMTSSIWYHPTIWQYLIIYLRRGVY